MRPIFDRDAAMPARILTALLALLTLLGRTCKEYGEYNPSKELYEIKQERQHNGILKIAYHSRNQTNSLFNIIPIILFINSIQ